MNLSKTIADLFSREIIAEHTATGISESTDSTLLLAREWGNNMLAEVGDSAQFVFETNDGYAISGKTHAVIMADTEMPGGVLKKLPVAGAPKNEGESALKALSDDVYKAVFDLLDDNPDCDGKEAGRIATAVQRAYVKALKESIDEAIEVYGSGTNCTTPSAVSVYGSGIQLAPGLFIKSSPDYSVSQFVMNAAIVEHLKDGGAEALVKGIAGKLKESKKVPALDIELTDILKEEIEEGGNYIKDLKGKHEGSEARIKAGLDAITELRKYLSSPKFHEDTTIQVSDVNRWLDRVVKALNLNESIENDDGTINEGLSDAFSRHAGGTGAAEGKHGYTHNSGKGTYHIDPVSTNSGRHSHYSLKFADDKGKVGGGLWHDLGKHSRATGAMKAANEHHKKNFGSGIKKFDPEAAPEKDESEVLVDADAIFESIEFALGPILTSTDDLNENRQLLSIIDAARKTGDVAEALEAAGIIAQRCDYALQLREDECVEALPVDEADLDAQASLVEFIKQMKAKGTRHMKVGKPKSDGCCREGIEEGNAGKDKDKAAKQAQANADSSGESRYLHMHAGTYWISNSKVADSEEFKPTKKTEEGAQSFILARASKMINANKDGKPDNSGNLVQTGPGTKGVFSCPSCKSGKLKEGVCDACDFSLDAIEEGYLSTQQYDDKGEETHVTLKHKGKGDKEWKLLGKHPNMTAAEKAKDDHKKTTEGTSNDSMAREFVCPKCGENQQFDDVDGSFEIKCQNCGHTGYAAKLNNNESVDGAKKEKYPKTHRADQCCKCGEKPIGPGVVHKNTELCTGCYSARLKAKTEGTAVDSMDKEFVCPKCGENGTFEEVPGGTDLKCPNCGKIVHDATGKSEAAVSEGDDIIAQIKKIAGEACRERKAGKIPAAQKLESQVDALIKKAKTQGKGEEAEEAEQEAQDDSLGEATAKPHAAWIEEAQALTPEQFRDKMESEEENPEFPALVEAVCEAYRDAVREDGRGRSWTRKITAANPIIKRVTGKGLDFERLTETTSASVTVTFPAERAQDFFAAARDVGVPANYPVIESDEGYAMILPEPQANKLALVFQGSDVNYVSSDSLDEREPTKNTGIHDHLKSKGFQYKGTKGTFRHYENKEGETVRHQFPTSNGNHSIHHADAAGKTKWKSPSASDTEIKQHFK